MLNNVVLIGRLTKDPELRYTGTGKAVVTLRLAVDRGTTNSRGEKETDFIDAVAWEKQAEAAANHLVRGSLVAIQGRIQVRQWNKDDGQKRERVEVVANTVRFLDKGKQQSEGGGMGDGFDPGTSDDIPFSM